MAHNICGDKKGIEYTRYEITTTELDEFIRQKVDSILEEMRIDTPHRVICIPIPMGDKRNGIKYAAMAICMSGVGEEEVTLYDKIRQFNYRPHINKGIQNAIYNAYQFSTEKLRGYLENPRGLRGMSLSVKDIEKLLENRQLRVMMAHGTPFYVFYADMDRILDEFLLNAEDPTADIPQYTVLGIKALGDKPDSPLSYDVMVCESGGVMDTSDTAEIFKALVNQSNN